MKTGRILIAMEIALVAILAAYLFVGVWPGVCALCALLLMWDIRGNLAELRKKDLEQAMEEQQGEKKKNLTDWFE